ncbi:unnamed protein product [Amoebophrya sp. A25]|nr:unnamed protein product [Amoebophrya sp. A25]|eukprot:GSA25T00019476001.1
MNHEDLLHQVSEQQEDVCVFDYGQKWSIRRPPFSENYVVSTDLPQWIRTHGKNATSSSHPLLVFRQPVRNVHVTLEDASQSPKHHHFNKILWDAFFDGTQRIDMEDIRSLRGGGGGSDSGTGGSRAMSSSSGFSVVTSDQEPRGLLSYSAARRGKTTGTTGSIPPHIPNELISSEARATLKLHVTADGEYIGKTYDEGIGFGPKRSQDVDEELFFDVLWSPRVPCPGLARHPLTGVTPLGGEPNSRVSMFLEVD